MYILTFATPQEFEILYEGLTVANGFSGGELRLVDSLFNKMETISFLKQGSDGLKGLRTLSADQTVAHQYCKLSLENAEFELLKKHFNQISWTSQGARLAYKVYEYLQNLQPSS